METCTIRASQSDRLSVRARDCVDLELGIAVHFGIIPSLDDFSKFPFVSEAFGSVESKGFFAGFAQRLLCP